MVAPNFTEILIVAIGFGIVGTYMWIAHCIVASGESAAAKSSAAPVHRPEATPSAKNAPALDRPKRAPLPARLERSDATAS